MNKERNKEIYEYWKAHRNDKPRIGVRKIGKMYHLSGARVHQIIKKMACLPKPCGEQEVSNE